MPKTFAVTSKPTTNANLTGVVTSVGNATSIASQTGTGTKFVVDTSPTLITPIIGVATGTSLDLGATTLYGSRAITVDTGGVLNIDIGSAAGDDFTVDTSKLVVEGDTGNVGIGTTGPGAKLNIYNSSGYTANKISSGSINIDLFANSSSGVGLLTASTMKFFTDGGTTPAITVLATTGNVGIGITAPLAKLHIDQSSTTGAVPVLTVDQADVSEEFIRFIGTSANAVLTQSIVEAADVTTATIAGYLKIYVNDEGNQLTDQAYYLPIYTLV